MVQSGQIAAPVRYSIRQAMEQEHKKFLIQQSNDARQARYLAGRAADPDATASGDDATLKNPDQPRSDLNPLLPAKSALIGAAVKLDFFGRPIKITDDRPSSAHGGKGTGRAGAAGNGDPGRLEEGKVWLTYHEGFSNAVRKPITLDELLRSF